MKKNKLFTLLLWIIAIPIILHSCEPKKSTDFDSKVVSEPNKFNNEKVKTALLDDYLNEQEGQYYFKYEIDDSSKLIPFEKVVPIFKTYCTPCHFKGGNVPFSLTKYSSIKKRAKAIKEALLSNLMPPWKADESYNSYHNSQAIPDSLRAQLILWLDRGASGYELEENELIHDKIEQADLKFEPTPPFVLSSEKDDYVCNIIDPHFDQETYVKAFTFQSDNINLIHHYTLFADTTGKYLDASNPWSCKTDEIFNHVFLIDTWAKGIRFIEYKQGLAYRFPKETKFLLQTHYSGYGNKGKSESCIMGIFTVQEKPRNEVNWQVLNNTNISIPANTVKSDGSKWEIREDITLLGAVPHMHYLGKKIEIFAINPEGEKSNIVYIPDWSYVVQSKYMLKEPIFLPKGSIIYNNVVYDNTDKNPEQPNDPIKDVHYAQSSYDEMMAVGYYYVKGEKLNSLPSPTVQFIR